MSDTQSRSSYRLKRFANSQDPEFASAMMLYIKNTEPAARTNTNEIAYWTDNFEATFGTPFYVFGFFRDRQLVGFAEAAYLKNARTFALDYLILDEAHRKNNVFYEFVDHLKNYLESVQPEYQFGVLEAPYGPGETVPSPDAQLLIRLMKLQGFHIVQAPYYQPRLRLDDAESEMKADLLVHSPARLHSMRTDTYLTVVRAIYYDYYLPWKSLESDKGNEYRKHLDRLFGSIERTVNKMDLVTVNGHKTLLSAKGKNDAMTMHRVVRFAFQASAVVVALLGVMLALRAGFELSNSAFAMMFLLALTSFVALAGIVSKEAREVLSQLFAFGRFVWSRRSQGPRTAIKPRRKKPDSPDDSRMSA